MPAADRSGDRDRDEDDLDAPEAPATSTSGAPAPAVRVPDDDATPGGTGSAAVPVRGEAATEAKWRRWRRQKPEDDFGFSDLRDPDEKGTGPGGRPGR